jgi:translation elongation factor aEF-1 beta
MAIVVLSFKIMPESVEADSKKIQDEAVKKIREFLKSQTAEVRTTLEPIAFGLNAIIITFADTEQHADTEIVEKILKEIPQVQSAENTEFKRAIG